MNKSFVCCAVLAAVSFSSVANEPGKIVTQSGLELIPQLDVGFKNDSNIYSSANDEVSSSIFTVDPSLAILSTDGLNTYALNIAIKSGFYSKDSNDNYLDGSLGFLGHFEASSRSRFDLQANANRVTEPRGSGLSEGAGNAIEKPVRYADTRLFAEYEYGAQTAMGRVAVRGEYKNKEYQNYRDISKFRDLSNALVGAKFIYNPQTGNELFADVSFDSISYAHTRATELNRDSNDIRALAGVQWQATAATSGSFKLGYQKKDFSDAGRENFTGVSWQGQVDWQPLSYTTLSLNTASAAVDPLTEGDYIEETRHGVNWQHSWSNDFNTTLGLTYLNEEYVGVTRKDTTYTYTAKAAYQLLRWVNAAVYVDYNDKESTNLTLQHDKTVVGVNFALTM